MISFKPEDYAIYESIIQHIKTNWTKKKAKNGKVVGFASDDYFYHTNTKEYCRTKGRRKFDQGETIVHGTLSGRVFFRKSKRNFENRTDLLLDSIHSSGDVWENLVRHVKKEMLFIELNQGLEVKSTSQKSIKI